jgi:hypothetical protein
MDRDCYLGRAQMPPLDRPGGAMGERNSANAQTGVELKTARWRPRREIDEFAAAGPAPIPFTASLLARRPGPHRSPHAGHLNVPPAGYSLHVDGLIIGVF